MGDAELPADLVEALALSSESPDLPDGLLVSLGPAVGFSTRAGRGTS